MSEKSVIAFGELLWDCLPTGPVLGGAPANFALRLHNLGVAVSLVSKVAKDELGIKARLKIKELGLSDSLIQTDIAVPTGSVKVEISPDGDASYTILRNVAYDYITSSPELEVALKKSSLICFGSLIQRGAVSRATLLEILESSPHLTKLLDINLRKDCYTPETIDSSLRYADILKLNDSEVTQVSRMLRGVELDPEDFCDLVFQYYPIKHVLVTRADKGVFAKSKSGEIVDLPGIAVVVVDTIGSGDAFTAGFVAQFLKNKSLKECCEFGNKLGALVATKQGGMAPLTRKELIDFASDA